MLETFAATNVTIMPTNLSLINDTLSGNSTPHVLLDHVGYGTNVSKIANVLVLTTATKGLIMFYNVLVLVIGVFANIGVLYLSLRHSKFILNIWQNRKIKLEMLYLIAKLKTKYITIYIIVLVMTHESIHC